MSLSTVNCGRCAHLWNRAYNQPGFGRCACHARKQITGKIRELVSLDATCEHAQLSAKYDPDFLPRLRAARRGEWELPDPPNLPDSSPPQSPVNYESQDLL